MSEEIPTQTQEQINEFLEKEEQKWIYSLWNGDETEDGNIELDVFINAGTITIKRFITDGNNFLIEKITIKPEELYKTIDEFFRYKKNYFEALKDD